MNLSRPFDSTTRWNDKTIHLAIPFDRVLLVYEIWDDRLLAPTDKVRMTNDLLIARASERYWAARRPVKEQTAFVQFVFDNFINTRQHRRPSGARCFDYVQDADYLYASFMSDYGIDLIEEKGRLDWRKFNALFQGLTEHCKIARVISIRLQEVPEVTKYNEKERQAIIDAKQYYALDQTIEEREEHIQEGLADLFNTLKGWAESPV